MAEHSVEASGCPVVGYLRHPGEFEYLGSVVSDSLLSRAYRNASEGLLFDTTLSPEEALRRYTAAGELAKLMGIGDKEVPPIHSKADRYVPGGALAGISCRIVQDDGENAEFRWLAQHHGTRSADDPLSDLVEDIRATLKVQQRNLTSPESPDRERVRAWRRTYNNALVVDESRQATKQVVTSGRVMRGVDGPYEIDHSLLLVGMGMDGQPQLRGASNDTRLEVAHQLGPHATRRLYMEISDFRRKPKNYFDYGRAILEILRHTAQGVVYKLLDNGVSEPLPDTAHWGPRLYCMAVVRKEENDRRSAAQNLYHAAANHTHREFNMFSPGVARRIWEHRLNQYEDFVPGGIRMQR